MPVTDLRLPPALDTSRPVLLLGGEANAVEVTRHFARHGIDVRVSGSPNCCAMHSRHCREAFPVPWGRGSHDAWDRLLLSADRRLDGHVLLTLDDDAIGYVTAREAALRARYVVEEFRADLRAALLDKQQTLHLAAAVGTPHPRFWPVSDPSELDALRGDIVFPAMVKPIHTHRFVEAFGAKLFIVPDGFDALRQKVALACARGLPVMVTEMVPGPDDLLSSYYTYLDEDGRPLFRYTKRVVRRYPPNRGGAVYHVSQWLPETAAAGQAFLEGIGWRGLANIEFKRDPRDGRLKIIEVNSRFTAAHRLLVRSGAPIDLAVYCRLTGQEGPRFTTFRQDLRLWYPLRDFRAFLALRRAGELSLGRYLASLPHGGWLSPVMCLGDPMPALARLGLSLSKLPTRLGFRVT